MRPEFGSVVITGDGAAEAILVANTVRRICDDQVDECVRHLLQNPRAIALQDLITWEHGRDYPNSNATTIRTGDGVQQGG